MIKAVFIVSEIVCAIAILICAAKSKRPLRFIVLSVLSGLASFAIMCFAGKYIGISLPANPWTVGYSAAAGVPGVAFMVAVKMVWNL
jgi:pro-sigmaK processing inhibitor BofA